MRKCILQILFILGVLFTVTLGHTESADKKDNSSNLDASQIEEIDRKVDEYLEVQKQMLELQTLTQEHMVWIQERYKIFLEKINAAETQEDKYRLQLEFKAEQDNAKAKLQEKIKAFHEQKLSGKNEVENK